MRKRPLYEVIGQLGMWGFIINGAQTWALEGKKMKDVPWGADISKSRYLLIWSIVSDLISAVGLLFAFTVAMMILYTIAPMLYRMASSAYFNLSLLSSDFYGLLFGLFLYVGFIDLLSSPTLLIPFLAFIRDTALTGCTSFPSRLSLLVSSRTSGIRRVSGFRSLCFLS